MTHSFSQNIIHSTPAGGFWSYPDTWIGGVVPVNGDSVILHGPVSTYSFSGWCTSLNITETASLGGNGNQGNLFISGSLYNNGSILGSINYDLHGNLVNNQPWTGVDNKLKFTGLDHYISCSPGAGVRAQFLADDSLQNILLNSDLEINNEAALLGNSELYTQNHVLRIQGGSFQDCRIHAFDTLLFNSVIGNLVVSGHYMLKGTCDILGSINLEGEAVNYAKIRSLYGSASDLNLYGDFINEDTLEASTAGNLNVNVMKSAVNHGSWNANVTRFIGPADKHISQSPGHPFGGTQIASDNSGSMIYLDSDVELSSPGIYLNNNTLNCGSHTLSANSTFDHGIIISESEIQGNSDFWNTTLKGNLKLSGTNRFSNCTTDGVIENNGLLKDITFYGGLFSSYGHLVNHGTIQSVHFNIYGNLTNTGTLGDYSIVDITGNTTQYILITSPIESPTTFYSDITGNSYQWTLNGEDILNQQSSTLVFNSLQLSDAGVYQCRVNTDHGTEYSREIFVNDATALPESRENKGMFSIYPNPFTQKAVVSAEIREPSLVRITLTDPVGRPLALLYAGDQQPGMHQVEISGSGLTPGMYLVEIEIECAGGKSGQILKLLHR